MPSPNILLVILDSVRAKNCSLYDHKNKTTPFLTELASESITFEQARAPSIHSISSHTSIFTGYHVEEHQITEHKSFVKPSETVWYHLSTNHNYQTGLFTSNVIVSQTSNLADSFETCVGPKRANFRLFDDALAPLDIQGKLSTKEFIKKAIKHEKPIQSILNGVYKKVEPRGGSQDPSSERADVYVDEFIDWIDKNNKPWAACINLMDTHTPFEPAEKYNKWCDKASQQALERTRKGSVPERFTEEFWDHLKSLEPLYDGTIRQADAAVERLVNLLSDRDVLDDTLLIVTSDHGEGFGERSQLDSSVRLRHHSWGIDEVLTHVPLLVRPPEGTRGRTVEQPASLTQFPTVVKSILNGNSAANSFVPDEDVLASTYRIRPPGNELDLPESDRTSYFGPWRAIYRSDGNTVVKYARRGEVAVELSIPDAQKTIQRDEDDGGVVDEVFNSLSDVRIRLGEARERDMEDDVEQRLADLGYLR
jgi:arylsulfatase A-like enzyme